MKKMVWIDAETLDSAIMHMHNLEINVFKIKKLLI